MPTAPSLEFFFLVLKCGIQVVLKPSGVESAKQSPRGSSCGLDLEPVKSEQREVTYVLVQHPCSCSLQMKPAQIQEMLVLAN